MNKQSVVGGLVLLVAFGTALAGGRTTYRTPQEAFDAAKKAIAREDWKGSAPRSPTTRATCSPAGWRWCRS
jgi:hypothetical protein